MKVYALIATVIIVVLLIGFIKYRASTNALSYYIIKKYNTLPTDEELKECTETVIKHWVGKD